MSYAKTKRMIEYLRTNYASDLPKTLPRLDKELKRCKEGLVTDQMITFCNILNNTLIEKGRITFNRDKAFILELTIGGADDK